MITRQGRYTTATIMTDDVEESALEQIDKMTNHRVFTNPIVVMPDVDDGVGSVIGFTMKLTKRVVPNVIGVDIGCGVLCMPIEEGLEQSSYTQLDDIIREYIPFGQKVHTTPRSIYEDLWADVKMIAKMFAKSYEKEFDKNIEEYIPDYGVNWFMKKCRQVGIAYDYAISSIGTLGGGNHFIEIGKSRERNDKRQWLTIHSGSRNFGYKIAKYWQDIAHEKLNNIDKASFNERLAAIKLNTPNKRQLPVKIEQLRKELGLIVETPHKELEYLEDTEDVAGYLFDMIFAQQYAKMNREEMADIIQRQTSLVLDWEHAIDSIHNYIDFEDMIIRKGAIRSWGRRKMVIPLNMKSGTLVCVGKSNKSWNDSAPHGAGRVMSRSEARKKLDVDEFKDKMRLVFSTSVNENTIDESPMAYKRQSFIREAIEPTATISVTIRPLMNLKDNGDNGRERNERKT